jgi:hypothetical protein
MPTSNSLDISQWMPAIRQLPVFGDKLSQALQYIVDGVNLGHANAAVAAAGSVAPPPRLDSFNVTTDAMGFAYFGLKHNGNIQRGVNYFVEHADNPGFVGAHIVHLGTSRNGVPLYIGNSTRYFRAYAGYQGSDEVSERTNFGGASPTAVTGGGSAPAAFQQSYGAGTAPTDGSQPGRGFGPVLYRGPAAAKRTLSS